jgi:putative phosphonate metabolism protein
MINKTIQPYRVAVYYAPDTESEWWRAGSRWLGRCAASGASIKQPALRSISSDVFHSLTSEPRRYGWHATLKAPFRLAPGCDLEQLCSAVQTLSRSCRTIDLPPLQVTRMGDFLALLPVSPPAALNQLATDCVQQLHGMAAPLGADELARRRQAALTVEQDALLLAWGYPWVMEHFRFHLSLTGPLSGLAPTEVDALVEEAAELFHCFPPCRIDRLSIFVEPTPGADFLLQKQLGFQA